MVNSLSLSKPEMSLFRLHSWILVWTWKWKSLSCVGHFATPMDYTVHGILQASIQEWVAFPFSRGSSQPRDWTQVSHIPGRHFNLWDNWVTFTYFTMLCWFAVQQHESAISTHISPPSWASLPPLPHSTPLGHHRAPRWAPCGACR